LTGIISFRTFIENIFMKKMLTLPVLLFSMYMQAQNVGIGTINPQAKLQINHRSSNSPGIVLIDSAANLGGILRFQNINYTRGMMLSGFSGSANNNGQYLDIRSDSLYVATFKGNGFTGIRNFDPAYPLDVSGDINTTGKLRINGNTGSDGQVLVSGGSATAPSWRNAALDNNTRFAVSFTHVTGSMIADAAINATKYNLNTSDAVIGANSITINRSGLYHFDINVSAFISYSVPPVPFAAMDLTFYTGTISYPFMNDRLMTPNSPSNVGFRTGETYSLECYVQAPAILRLAYSFGFTTPITYFMSGFLTGHLISE